MSRVNGRSCLRPLHVHAPKRTDDDAACRRHGTTRRPAAAAAAAADAAGEAAEAASRRARSVTRRGLARGLRARNTTCQVTPASRRRGSSRRLRRRRLCLLNRRRRDGGIRKSHPDGGHATGEFVIRGEKMLRRRDARLGGFSLHRSLRRRHCEQGCLNRREPMMDTKIHSYARQNQKQKQQGFFFGEERNYFLF